MIGEPELTIQLQKREQDISLGEQDNNGDVGDNASQKYNFLRRLEFGGFVLLFPVSTYE